MAHEIHCFLRLEHCKISDPILMTTPTSIQIVASFKFLVQTNSATDGKMKHEAIWGLKLIV